jgi:hypothetical protein
LSSQSKVILIAQGWDSALENTVKKQLIRMNERKGKSNNEINAKKRTRYKAVLSGSNANTGF